MTFTTFTLVASFILFRGFNTTDAINTISLLCGFLTIFTGVYLLNISRDDPEGRTHMQLGDASRYDLDGIPTDGMAAPLTRRSMQARRSSEATTHSRSGSLNLGGGGGRYRKDSTGRGSADGRGDREALMHSYDLESGGGDARFGLADLAEDSDEEVSSGGSGNKRTSFGDGAPQRPKKSRALEFASVRTKGSADFGR